MPLRHSLPIRFICLRLYRLLHLARHMVNFYKFCGEFLILNASGFGEKSNLGVNPELKGSATRRGLTECDHRGKWASDPVPNC